ncbi:MAG: MucB/RseB C-terminal domain-containing protein [Betaproteobacteria bacterium]|nr:MucB/RseB C-terminal domain-containing protein [Betaproteobacteria bacterium]
MSKYVLGMMLSVHTALVFAQALPVTDRWLDRIYQATQKLSYTGTFVYQQGERTETSRITRLSDSGGGIEKLEALDGTPREIVRTRDEVRCYLPESRTVKIDKRGDRRGFPGLLPEQRAKLSEHYAAALGRLQRAAGFDCQEVVLTPRDILRYGYRLCADVKTGMLLKATVVDEAGAIAERFTFTQWTLGGVTPAQLKSRFATSTWRIEDASATVANMTQAGWMFSVDLPGFEKVAEVTRKLGDAHPVGQVVFSDGLAAVSVFLEPAQAQGGRVEAGLAKMGAVHIYTREIGAQVITAVGEVPAASVRRIAHAIEFRAPR